MLRFLFTVWPLAGHLHPSLEIARALKERGYDCAFYCSEKARTLIEKEGFLLFPFKRIDELRLDRVLFSRERSMSCTRPFRLMTLVTDWLLDTVPQQTADLEDILASFEPDLIICDETMWGPTLILHEKYQLPVAVCSVFAGCMLPGPDAPVWGLGLGPPRSRSARFRNWLIERITDFISAGVRRRASGLRENYGLSPLSTSVRELVGKMPLYLVRGAPEFDYERRDLPPTVHYVGPLEWTGDRIQCIPEWLTRLSPEKPVVYVSEGTMHTRAPVLLRAAARGLANLDVQVIMTIGVNRKPEDLGLRPLAPNIRVEQWISQKKLFLLTDVAITVGGAGTVLGALSAGVPLLVVPAESDQPDNARRVAETGVGLCLPRRRCTPERLRRAVERLIREPAFRQNARQMASIFETYDGGTRASDLIEGFMVKNMGDRKR
jgi:MGT family glycosyltransferase